MMVLEEEDENDVENAQDGASSDEDKEDEEA
jgi:hypothetical protein